MVTKIISSKFFDLILIFLFLILFFAIDSMAQTHRKISIHGHRGARAIHPENTLKAFNYALDVGVDVLEFDLSVTKDNILVVSHDPTINPNICLDENGNKIKNKPAIYSLTLEQVKKFDCGTLKNPRFPKQQPSPKEKIPTLSEVFELVKNSNKPAAKTVEFNIETKIFPYSPSLTPSPEVFAKLLYEEIKKHEMVKRVIIQSFDYRTLVAIRKLDPTIRISQLISDNLPDLLKLAQNIGANFISPNWEWITEKEVLRLHKNNIQVAPWTANTKESWKYLINIGVDAIITDDPQALKDFLAVYNANESK